MPRGRPRKYTQDQRRERARQRAAAGERVVTEDNLEEVAGIALAGLRFMPTGTNRDEARVDIMSCLFERHLGENIGSSVYYIRKRFYADHPDPSGITDTDLGDESGPGEVFDALGLFDTDPPPEVRDMIERAVAALPEPHRTVVLARYLSGRDAPAAYIGDMLGVTRSRVNQIENEAMEWVEEWIRTGRTPDRDERTTTLRLPLRPAHRLPPGRLFRWSYQRGA